MASLSSDKNGNRRIQFMADDGSRKSFRLGAMPLKDAKTMLSRVEALLSCKMVGSSLDASTAAWLKTITPKIHDKLAAVGLLEPRGVKVPTTLDGFFDHYLATRTDIKPGTRTNLEYARKYLEEYFGPAKPLLEITEGDADEFRLHLRKTMAENTVRRLCGRARQLFEAASKKKYIESNPFGTMKNIAVQGVMERFYYVTVEEAAKVMMACPDPEWRTIFVLSRFGGLRCPSETLGLRWDDINWDTNRIVVRSPKTEHHEGKGFRIVPMFPEIKKALSWLRAMSEPETVYVVNRYRGESNLRSQMTRIIRRAGIEPWPKIFQNLRSTRETELAEHFPMHVVCQWIGNSESVAKRHYLQVTSDHFDRAVQIPAQQPPERCRIAPQPSMLESEKPAEVRPIADSCGSVSYPVWIRTRNESTKNSSVTSYTTG